MFQHETVLAKEAVAALNIKADGIYVDCTLGGAGHSMLIASQLGPAGWLVGIDQDSDALQYAEQQLSTVTPKVTLIHGNFRDISTLLRNENIKQVDGVLYDLGVSSPQLDQAERGFSYSLDAPLDMRMDREQPVSASEIVNTWDEENLTDIFFRYGEERFSRRIARHIVLKRKKKPIETTGELADLIKECIPVQARRSGPHPAKRIFQAIRIAVNDELNAFSQSLEEAWPLLRSGGRLAVISFHSLEDRICKQFFKRENQPCICPPDLPQCACGKTPTLNIITRKPMTPSADEIRRNPRARSAKLRVAERL